jgi:hypothetical protein
MAAQVLQGIGPRHARVQGVRCPHVHLDSDLLGELDLLQLLLLQAQDLLQHPRDAVGTRHWCGWRIHTPLVHRHLGAPQRLQGHVSVGHFSFV